MFPENQAAYLADFGETLLVAGVEVRGHWFDAWTNALDVSTTGPAFGAFDLSLPTITVGLSYVIRGAIVYRIVDRLPDGTGWSILRLEKQ